MRTAVAVLLMALPMLQATCGEPVTWRVAGILQGAGGSVAIMESSSGEQSLYRVGDEIADAHVAHIGADRVTLKLDRHEIVLLLRGTSHALVAGSVQPAASDAVPTQTVVGRYAVQRLQQLLGEAADEPQLQAGAAKLFRLPPGAAITGLNHAPSSALRPVLETMLESLQLGRTVSVEFDGDDGPGSVYIYPEN